MRLRDVMNTQDGLGLYCARTSANMSDRPVKVGAAVVGRKGKASSTGLGWNQLPMGVAEIDTTHSRTVHAEIAAILHAEFARGATLYVTCPVCHLCASVVIHAGISRVVTLPPPPGLADWYEASFAAARAMFAEAGVECVEVGDV